MRKVPILSRDPSSTHRSEKGHTCVSFDDPWEKSEPQKTTLNDLLRKTSESSTRKKNPKKSRLLRTVIILAILSMLSSVFEMVDSVTEISPEPDYLLEEFIPAGEGEARDIPAIEPQILYQDAEFSVTASSAGLYYGDYVIILDIANTSDRDITFSVSMTAANGCMFPSNSIYLETEAGESYQEYLHFYSYDMEQAGIDQIGQVEFTLELYDTEDYYDIAKIDPAIIRTEAADSVSNPTAPDGLVIYSSEDVRMTLQSTEMFGYNSCEVTLFIENHSDQTLWVDTPAVYINNAQAEGFLFTTLRPNTVAVDTIYFYDLEELGIDSIDDLEQITLDLQLEYAPQWRTVEATVTFSPQ